MGPEQILAKKREFIIPCLNHFYQEPVQFVRGQGQHLYDSNGRQYLDSLQASPSSTPVTATRRSPPGSASASSKPPPMQTPLIAIATGLPAGLEPAIDEVELFGAVGEERHGGLLAFVAGATGVFCRPSTSAW